jgi:GAF domain-containing protein
MSNQIAVALNNALAFRQTEQQVQQQVQINELNRTLLNSASLADLYYNLTTSLGSVIEYDYLSLTLVHGDSQNLHEYRLNANANPVISEGPLRSKSNSLSGRAFERHQLFVSRTLEQEQPSLEDLADWRREGFQTAMSLPLLVGSHALGTLNVASRKPDAFLMSKSRQYEQIANQVAVALENVRLAEAQQRTLHDMEALARQLTGQAWEKQMQRLPEQARNKQYLRSGVPANLPAILLEAERAGEMQQPVVWTEAAEQTASTQPQATLTAPITLRGEVLGALQVGETSQARKWSEEDIIFMQAVADQVALALDNARLIEETERRAERERLVAEVSSRMFASNDLESIIQIAGQELGRVLRVDRAAIKINPNLAAALQAEPAPSGGNGLSAARPA